MTNDTFYPLNFVCGFARNANHSLALFCTIINHVSSSLAKKGRIWLSLSLRDPWKLMAVFSTMWLVCVDVVALTPSSPLLAIFVDHTWMDRSTFVNCSVWKVFQKNLSSRSKRFLILWFAILLQDPDNRVSLLNRARDYHCRQCLDNTRDT